MTVDDRTFYRQLLLLRRTEERIIQEYPKYEMRSPPHIYIGQEAVAVGCCAAMRRDDSLFPYYRSHGWYLAKGGDIRAMVAELHGRETGCSRGWGGSMHLIDLAAGVMGTSAIVAGSMSHAIGAAVAFRTQRLDRVAAVCFGDGATEEGVFHESLNFAQLRKLPVVFICENNLYATCTHINDRQAQPDIYKLAAGYGLPGVQVDGNDVRAVHAAALAAVDRARRGDGPTLIECRTYRLIEHCGIFEDYQIGYRTAEEGSGWKARDPLAAMHAAVTDPERARLEDEIRELIDDAFAFARASAFPTSLYAGAQS